MTNQIFKANQIIRDIAIVSTINNKAGLKYEGGQFIKYGDPTEVALKVVAEKLG